jgi:hypothetical protein
MVLRLPVVAAATFAEGQITARVGGPGARPAGRLDNGTLDRVAAEPGSSKLAAQALAKRSAAQTHPRRAIISSPTRTRIVSHLD